MLQLFHGIHTRVPGVRTAEVDTQLIQLQSRLCSK
jgi:hypothetical protein